MEITLFYRVRLQYLGGGSTWNQTNRQCLTTQFRPTSLFVPLIVYWGINYMGDYWNLDILRGSYVSPYPSSSYSGTFLSNRMEIMRNELMVREHSPGSLREPMQTSLWPAHGMVKLGTTFGLIAAAVRPINVERSSGTDI